MKSLTVILVCAVLTTIGGFVFIERSLDDLTRFSMNSIKYKVVTPLVPEKPFIEPPVASQSLSVTSGSLTMDEITEPSDVQPALAYRMFQPTISPQL